jgi:hypothetical protein
LSPKELGPLWDLNPFGFKPHLQDNTFPESKSARTPSSDIVTYVQFLLFHYPLSNVIGGLAITLLGIGVAYYIRARPSLKVSRVVYICLGFGVGWVMWLIYAFTGVGRWATDTVGVWPALIISDVVFYVAGALTGDWIGKRRNYRMPLSL